jgi:transposase
LANGVNANMVFKWRRELRAGLFEGAPHESPKLLPVVLTSATAVEPIAAASAQGAPAAPACMIEIVIADALVRVHGNADAALLRVLFQSLRA